MSLISALYNFWRRGKKADFHFFLDFWAKTDLQLFFENDDDDDDDNDRIKKKGRPWRRGP